jgi:hypothetical protein
MAGPSLSKERKVGPDGAAYCVDADDFERILKKEKPRSNCGVIPPGTTTFVTVTKEIGDMSAGLGIADGINDGKPIHILFVGKTAEAPRSFDTRQFKRVDAPDIRNTPEKWIGRDIEIRNVNVYWVADDDVRFLTNSSLTIFGSKVQGADADFLRENCETQREAASSKCRANIRFSYSWHGEDNPGGLAKRVVIKTSDVMAIRQRPR